MGTGACGSLMEVRFYQINCWRCAFQATSRPRPDTGTSYLGSHCIARPLNKRPKGGLNLAQGNVLDDQGCYPVPP